MKMNVTSEFLSATLLRETALACGHGWEEKMRIGITHPSKVLTHVSDRV